MANKWMARMAKEEESVKYDFDPFSNILTSRSPSVNYLFGRTHGLPFGYSVIFFGPAKGGKSLIINDMIGNLHQKDPTAIAIKFDTEARSQLQTPMESNVENKLFGIDPNRINIFETNHPGKIFNYIAKDVAEMCAEGAPIRVIAIDSISGVQGRRNMDNNDVMAYTIADQASVITDGLRLVLPVIRKYKIALLITCQVRMQMDPNIAKYEKYKMGAATALQHFAEMFFLVEKISGKAARLDAHGNQLEDDNRRDMADHAQGTAHRIRATCKGNSAEGGALGRVGELTFDYKRGVINQYQEVFELGLAQGVIEKPNNVTYQFGDKSWRGREAILESLKGDPVLYDGILLKVKELDAMPKKLI